MIIYFLSEIVFRAVGGATGAFTAAGAFKPDGFQTRGGAEEKNNKAVWLNRRPDVVKKETRYD